MENGGLVPHSVVVSMSKSMIADARSMRAFINLYDPRTPAERNAERQVAADRRAAERAAADHTAATVEKLIEAPSICASRIANAGTATKAGSCAPTPVTLG